MWVDAVEKVGRGRRARNNRIDEVCYSNQGCALDWRFESKLRCGTLKIKHHRSKAAAPFNTRMCASAGCGLEPRSGPPVEAATPCYACSSITLARTSSSISRQMWST
jgi:hypothetical protein